jgi:NADPH-dependent 2,4-dienoyl-CoA reductase/sulfur reductase-like enzyme
MTRHVIIGLGVAGVSAAQAIRSADRTAEIVLVSDDPHGFYSRPGLAYYLTGELPEKQLTIFTREDWKRLNARFVHSRVTRLLPEQHRLELGNHSALSYDRLLFATGATAQRLSVPGADLQGVVVLDNLEDTRTILHLARRARRAVVVGGGILALELVEGLRACRVQVDFFLRGERYWPNVLDEAESRLVESRLTHEGVRLHPRTEVAEIIGHKGRVKAVRTTQGELIPCNMLACGIGVRPRIELAQAAGLETERGILVNEWMHASQPDIFAAGDVAQVYDPQTGLTLLDLLWHPARQQGHTAGLNMAGQPRRFERKTAVNVLRLAGIMTSIMGAVGSGRDEETAVINRGSSETWRGLPDTIAVASGGDVNLVRLVIGTGFLLGAVVMGDQTLSLPLQELITSQADISAIRSRLLEPQAPLGQLLMDHWYTISGKS